MPGAARLEVRDTDHAKPRSWVGSLGLRRGLARRARIALLAGEAKPDTEIATLVGVSRPTVIFAGTGPAEGRLAALEDRKRSGPSAAGR